MIDDTSEKVRRNVVVLSFFIILSQFFELELNNKITILNGISVNLNSPIKFWVVTTALLIYLFFRYWFDESRMEDWRQLRKEHIRIQVKLIKSLLNNDFCETIQ